MNRKLSSSHSGNEANHRGFQGDPHLESGNFSRDGEELVSSPYFCLGTLDQEERVPLNSSNPDKMEGFYSEGKKGNIQDRTSPHTSFQTMQNPYSEFQDHDKGHVDLRP